MGLSLLADTSAMKVRLPFVEESFIQARDLMGRDFWSYGVEANRKTLEAFLRHHHSQGMGLCSGLVAGEVLFDSSTFEMAKVKVAGMRLLTSASFPGATRTSMAAALLAVKIIEVMLRYFRSVFAEAGDV